ncbi:MAG TPA: OB-fold domain-containing protein [Acidobacteriota bacterium]|nr:OB-fold domain-containing protein [Acidobacteriota bacterium]
MTMEKPLPIPTPRTQPFWDALREHQVRLQRCSECQTLIYYPRSHCTHCLSEKLAWEDIGGEGTLYTYTVARRPTHPLFADEVPQLIIVVELEEGVRLTSTLVNGLEEDLEIGMRLKPVFEDIPDHDVTMLRYEPA